MFLSRQTVRTARVFLFIREVAAALGEPLKTPALDYTETEIEKEGFNVTVEAGSLPALHCNTMYMT